VCDGEETKRCLGCRKVLPIGKFPRRHNRKGVEFRENYCNSCAIVRCEWYERRDWQREETLNGKCMSIYSLCAFGEDDDNRNDDDGTTAYLRLMREINKGAPSLEEA